MENGLLNVIAKERTDEVRNRIFPDDRTSGAGLEHILEANIRTFENEHAGSLYRMAEEEKKKGHGGFQEQQWGGIETGQSR